MRRRSLMVTGRVPLLRLIEGRPFRDGDEVLHHRNRRPCFACGRPTRREYLVYDGLSGGRWCAHCTWDEDVDLSVVEPTAGGGVA